MRTILIKDYVSNNAIANELITNFDNNKLVVKGDTGIGGTTSILNITDKNVIIISPLAGMIVGKENKREPHQMFIYQNSKDKWNHYEQEIRSGEFIILNTTPEQIIELKKNNPSLFQLIMDIPFFVDEFQVYGESDYRKSMNEFYNILFNEHRGNFTLSTATPTYNNLDIPKQILTDMELITIKRMEKRAKPLTIEPLTNYYNFIKSNCDRGNKVVLFTNDINKIKNLINNDEFGYKIQLLLGETLAIKTSAIKTKSYKEYNLMDKSIVDLDADVYILSTRYLIGFDLEFDAAVGVIMNENSDVDNFNVNQLVQAYGRIRKNVIEASIFYNSNEVENESIIEIEKMINKVEYNFVYLSNIQSHIGNLNNSLSYPQSNLIKSLTEYGFEVNVDEESNEIRNSTSTFGNKYQNLINQENKDQYFLQKELIKVYSKIKGDDSSYNGFNQKQLLLWAAAYIGVVTDSDYLTNYIPERYERLLLRVKAFIDVNDLAYPNKMTEMDRITKFRVSNHRQQIAINDGALCKIQKSEKIFKNSNNKIELIDDFEETLYTKMSNLYYDDTFNKAKQIINSLYAINLVENGEYSTNTERIVHGFSSVSECLIDDYIKALSDISEIDVEAIVISDDKEKLHKLSNEFAYQLKSSEVFRNTNRKIIKRLKKLDGYKLYNQEEINQIMDKSASIKSSLIGCKHGIRNTIRMNTYSIRKQVERHKFYILSLLSISCSGHIFGFKTTRSDNRVFNPATKTTRQLRGYTPYQMLQCDIKSAFATFLDEIVGSNIAQDVYENIMKKKKVDRSQAKTLYNSMLNDYRRNTIKARAFFRICGYTNEQIKQILNITSKEKGGFYREMTKKEEQVIKDFKDLNRLDENAIRLHDAIFLPNLPKYQNLNSKIGDCKFEIKPI